jgi:hypothetical protein
MKPRANPIEFDLGGVHRFFLPNLVLFVDTFGEYGPSCLAAGL